MKISVKKLLKNRLSNKNSGKEKGVMIWQYQEQMTEFGIGT